MDNKGFIQRLYRNRIDILKRLGIEVEPTTSGESRASRRARGYTNRRGRTSIASLIGGGKHYPLTDHRQRKRRLNAHLRVKAINDMNKEK